MSASLAWKESDLVGEVVTTITNLNFGPIDDPNIVVASNTIKAGEHSYEKYIRVLFTGTWTEISNMKFWKSAGAYKTAETVKTAANVNFATPVATASAVATVNVPTTEGTALAINSYEGAAVITYGAPGVSGYSDYICLQLQTGITTEAGLTNVKVFTFSWDEQ
jgi:hypothetical protein